MNSPTPLYAPQRVSGRLLPGLWGTVINTLTVLSEVYLRSGFGDRYFTPLGFLGGAFTLLFLPSVIVFVLGWLLGNWLLGTFAGLFSSIFAARITWTQGTPLFHVYVVGFFVRGVWHFIDAEYRRRAGVRLLTTYSGRPSPFWKFIPGPFGRDESVIKRFGEPAVVVGAALLVKSVDVLLALYLGASGIALFLKGHFEHKVLVDQIHDIRDQFLQSESLAASSAGLPPGENRRGAALSAEIARIPDGEQDVVRTALQSRFAMSGLPAPAIPANPDADSLANLYRGLSSDTAGLITAPIPEPEPLTDWYVEEPVAATVIAAPEWEVLPDDAARATISVERTDALAETQTLVVKKLCRCPHCRRPIWIPTAKVGGQGKCARCGRVVKVTTELLDGSARIGA